MLSIHNRSKQSKQISIMNKRKKSAKPETIFEQEKRLRELAKELAKEHKDVKPIKYDLKR